MDIGCFMLISTLLLLPLMIILEHYNMSNMGEWLNYIGIAGLFIQVVGLVCLLTGVFSGDDKWNT